MRVSEHLVLADDALRKEWEEEKSQKQEHLEALAENAREANHELSTCIRACKDVLAKLQKVRTSLRKWSGGASVLYAEQVHAKDLVKQLEQADKALMTFGKNWSSARSTGKYKQDIETLGKLIDKQEFFLKFDKYGFIESK